MSPFPHIPIAFPFRGLSDQYGFDVQAPGTTRDLLNVRAIDPKTGRTRGAQRSGLNRFLDDVHAGSTDGDGDNYPILDLIAVPTDNDQLTYATDTTPDAVFAKTLPNEEDGADMVMDAFGSLYVCQPSGSVGKYNQDGVLLTEITIPDQEVGGGTAVPALSFVHVDEFQNVYVGRGDKDSPSAAEQAEARLYSFELQPDGTYLLGWILNSGKFYPDAVVHRKADGTQDLICIENDYQTGDCFCTIYPAFTFFSPPDEDTARRVTVFDDTTGGGARYGGRMAKRTDGVVYICLTDQEQTGALTQATAKVNMYQSESTSALIWTLTGVGNTGWGIALGPKNSSGNHTFYTCGNTPAGANGGIRRIEDLGTSADEGGTDFWLVTLTGEEWDETTGPPGRRLRLATDADGRLYLPGPGAGANEVLIYDTDGTELTSYSITSAGSSCLAVAVPQTKPQGMVDAGLEETEFVYATTTTGTGAVAFFKNKMVTVTNTAGAAARPTRSLTFLAAGGGTIESFTKGGAFSSVTGGTGALSATSPYIQSVVSMAPFNTDDPGKARQRVYYTDGVSYKKYDPADAAVTDWESATVGLIPPRCKLIELWQGRIVLARGPENPAAWHMSAIGNPENWDVLPQNPSPADAVSGVNARAGDCPDIVNSLLPWDDDLLLFGCDHSIWMMRGNPLMGGQFDLVTDQHGMAFGRPWTKDHGGQTVFYMDGYGGVHALQKGGVPVRITRDTIERRIGDAINFSTHFVRLVWNRVDEGLHVFQCPFYSDHANWATTSVKHWFWDRKNDAWFEDQFGTSTALTSQPTQVYLADGDAAKDRVLLLACEDQYVRAWDRDANSDDNVASTDVGAGHSGSDLAIDSYVTMGPIQPRDSITETRFQDFRAWLDKKQDGVNYAWYLDDEPDQALLHAPSKSGALNPGANASKVEKFTADTAYLRLRNANSGQRWALERMSIGYAPAGRKRVWS